MLNLLVFFLVLLTSQSDASQFASYVGVSTVNPAQTVEVSGNVGIGSTAPGQALDVSGGIRSRGTSAVYFGDDNNASISASAATAGDLRFLTNNTEEMRITNAGNVGIGTILTSGLLTVGNSSATSGVDVNSNSCDGNTIALWHFDSNFTDSNCAYSNITLTATSGYGSAIISSGQFEFGGTSFLLSQVFVDNHTSYANGPITNSPISGTGDWTVDFWVRLSSLTSGTIAHTFSVYQDTNNFLSFKIIKNTNNFETIYVSGGTPVFQYGDSWTPSLDTWYHVAVVRSSQVFKIFINGSQIGSSHSDSTSLSSSMTNLVMGAGPANTGNSGQVLNGYLDEVRVSNVARWTSNFTPPTSAYNPSSANPQIKFLNNRSQAGKIWTDSSNALKFDDSSLTRMTLSSGNLGIGTITPGSTLDLRGSGYISGNIGIGTTLTSNLLTVGNASSNPGIDINATGCDSDTITLWHFDSGLTDSNCAYSNVTLSATAGFGSAGTSSAQYEFGGASLLLAQAGVDNHTSYVSGTASNSPLSGTGDWTVDFWVRITTLDTGQIATVFSVYIDSSNFLSFKIYKTNTFNVIYVVGGIPVFDYSDAWTASLNTWYHVAVVRINQVFKTFINGSQIGSSHPDLSSLSLAMTGIMLGAPPAAPGNSGQVLDGYLDEVRVSNIARWTSNFTPSTSAYNPLLTTPQLRYLNNQSQVAKIWTDSSASNALKIDDSSSTRVTLLSGNLGVGTVNPQNTLSIGGSAAVGSSYATLAGPANGLIIQGNVGIGSLTPGSAFDVSGKIRLITAGNKFLIKEGTNACSGISTLSSGSTTVSTTCITSNSRVILSLQNCSSCGTVYLGTVTAGTSFVINSTNGSDASNVYWQVLDSL